MFKFVTFTCTHISEMTGHLYLIELPLTILLNFTHLFQTPRHNSYFQNITLGSQFISYLHLFLLFIGYVHNLIITFIEIKNTE